MITRVVRICGIGRSGRSGRLGGARGPDSRGPSPDIANGRRWWPWSAAVTACRLRGVSIRRGLILAPASVLVVVAGSGTVATVDPVETQDGSGEVRIVARRLADDRVEFGLQGRSAGGSWGMRLLPERRFLPASAAVDRWVASSPLEVALDARRVVARRLADDRVEFGLQVRAVGGSWGERLLPEHRFFPASAAVGRWLSSSPLRPARRPRRTPPERPRTPGSMRPSARRGRHAGTPRVSPRRAGALAGQDVASRTRRPMASAATG